MSRGWANCSLEEDLEGEREINWRRVGEGMRGAWTAGLANVRGTPSSIVAERRRLGRHWSALRRN